MEGFRVGSNAVQPGFISRGGVSQARCGFTRTGKFRNRQTARIFHPRAIFLQRTSLNKFADCTQNRVLIVADKL